MNYLVLVTQAPYHRPFFANVGQELVRRGHRVHYVLDSHYTDFLHPETPLDGDVAYFSDYFEANYATATVPDEFRGENLWAALFPDLDRSAYTRSAYRTTPHYYQRLVPNLLRFFCEIFDRHQIDGLVYEPVSNSFVYMAYLVAMHRGAKFLGFMSSRLPNRIDVLDGKYLANSTMAGIYREILDGTREVAPALRAQVCDYIDRFDAQRSDYMKSLQYLLESPVATYLKPKRLRVFGRSLRYLRATGERHFYAYTLGNPALVFPEHFARECVRYAKVRWIRQRYFRQPDLAANYFVYPMQFHPECSSSVNAVHYTDELTNVRNLSISMPFGLTLYVKDHPHAAGRQPTEFYDRVSRMPNVRLIDPDFDSKTLVRHAKAVVTCTSTMGYEALFFGVPVFVLGEAMYGFHPLCVRLASFADAFESFGRYASVRATRRELEAFVASYFLVSLEGSYSLEITHADRALAARLAEVIIREIGPRAAAAGGPPRRQDAAGGSRPSG